MCTFLSIETNWVCTEKKHLFRVRANCTSLSLYASKDVPVLIILSVYGDNQKDYDRPTYIEKYLNYLKDVKSYNKEIDNLKYDDMGKIIEIELIKK